MFDEKRYKKDNETTLTRTKTLLEPTKLTESEKALIKEKHLKAEQSILDEVISEIYSSEKEYTVADFPIKLDVTFKYPEELDCKDFILLLSEGNFYLFPNADYQEIVKLKDEYLQTKPYWKLIENKKVKKIYDILPQKFHKKFTNLYNTYKFYESIGNIFVNWITMVCVFTPTVLIIANFASAPKLTKWEQIFGMIWFFVFSSYIIFLGVAGVGRIDNLIDIEEFFKNYIMLEYKGINLSNYRVYGNKNE